MTKRTSIIAASIMVPTFVALALPAIAEAHGPREARGDRAEQQRQLTDEQRQALLDFLGLTQEEFEQALEDGKRPHEIAEQQGKTREDMEKFREEQGLPDHPGAHRREHREKHQELVAERLGMTVEELQQAHKDGVTMDQLLEQQGIDKDQFRQEMKEQMKQHHQEQGEHDQDDSDHDDQNGERGQRQSMSGKDRMKKGLLGIAG